MSNKIEEAVSKKAVSSTKTEQFNKSAFVDAAETNKEKLILQVALKDNQKYTRDQVKSLVDAWKKKGVK